MIQRWDFSTKGDYTLMGEWKYFPCMNESNDGDYILHDDHVAALAARDAVIRELLYATGTEAWDAAATKAYDLIGDTPNAKRGEE